jgi:hypothetical protein
MDVATCSFNEMRAEWGMAVAISHSVPTYRFPYLFVHYGLIVPRVLVDPSPEEVEPRYWAQLDEIGLERISVDLGELQSRFAKFANERVVLLCHEQKDIEATCHRRAFARWWNTRTGQIVPELNSILSG